MHQKKSVASVAFPTAIPGVYDYSIPPDMKNRVFEGTPVFVEVKSQRLWGMVVCLKNSSPVPVLKSILDVKSGMDPASFQNLIQLYEWMSAYYQCELGKIFKPFVRKRLLETAVKQELTYRASGEIPADLTPGQRRAALRLQEITDNLTKRQLIEDIGLSSHMITILCVKKVLATHTRTVLREPDQMRAINTENAIELTSEQQHAVDTLIGRATSPARPFLLYGITGSGKTHVYISLVKYMLSINKGAIVLVPEISLTPQTIQRFKSEIGDNIAIIHSNMSDGERRDNLEELMAGRKQIVIGVRSAILAPVNNLGLIVVDEEHDGSYKQGDPEPRYHARDVAIMRGRLQNALVILGSATPSLESYHNARQNKFDLLVLRSRYGAASLPHVTLVDMNIEHDENNWTFLSRYLRRRIEETIACGRQVILLLNRRGFASFLICKHCRHIYTCPNCSVNLVYHRHDTCLRCHQCGYTQPAPSTCPKCNGEQLQYKGTGIQKAEEQLREILPRITIIRMDQDTTRRKGSHVSILEQFANHTADILLGTQMVSKGLDFAGVALVGVLQADTGLHIPDFRASERTFQLLTQVAGRAGRKDSLGEVVIQTYLPEEPSILAAQNHDFDTFAAGETENRRELNYPPFCRLARIIVSGPREATVIGMSRQIRDIIKRHDQNTITILGPSPAILARIKSSHRYSLLLKSTSHERLRKTLLAIRKQFSRPAEHTKIIIDVDPLNML